MYAGASCPWCTGGPGPPKNFGVRQYTYDTPNPFTVTFDFWLNKNSNPFNLGFAHLDQKKKEKKKKSPLLVIYNCKVSLLYT